MYHRVVVKAAVQSRQYLELLVYLMYVLVADHSHICLVLCLFETPRRCRLLVTHSETWLNFLKQTIRRFYLFNLNNYLEVSCTFHRNMVVNYENNWMYRLKACRWPVCAHTKTTVFKSWLVEHYLIQGSRKWSPKMSTFRPFARSKRYWLWRNFGKLQTLSISE